MGYKIDDEDRLLEWKIEGRITFEETLSMILFCVSVQVNYFFL